ncbi:MAG: LPS export ABC transporter ATP-binding protein [Deltaproteobacteria bacterium]|nr:LPS export ABC transporter ATP-binding protein [Deltaproteobacteria bacterium]
MSLAAHKLNCADLVKIYNQRRVVDGVDLALSSGEIVGLLGPNGAGKTTSFYMIVGLVRPDQGTIVIDEKDITTQPMFVRARNGLTYLPQEPSVFRKLTVEENILAILEMLPEYSGRRKQQLGRMEELIVELDLKKVAKSSAFSLSGGERRRVEIARALACSPSFMLLDEPFAGIDPIVVGDLQDIVRKLKNSGIGVLITDHNVRETLNICDRAYIITDGKVVESGTPEKITSSEIARKHYLGDDFRM